MKHTLSDIAAKCDEADMVLVGIGEEFQYDWDILLRNERYQEIEKEIEQKEKKEREEYRWIVPFIQKMALEKYPDLRLREAYRNLQKIIEGKNYFILSITMDDHLYRNGFQEDRIVTPCGGFRKMQCDHNCCGLIMEPDEDMYQKVLAYFYKEIELEELTEPECEKCGQKKRFNQLGVSKYAEEGYLPQWNVYTKWLQGTVNKKLCVIELGAGMEMPAIIRWPFEKIVYYNQKSFLYRIHPALYQLGEKMGGRGAAIQEKSVDFLANGFV
ncbi:MAG: hypothetical protein HFI50_15640 [Lachnospiraceae bacterium]|jgi:NAD-dependent SIR2 family protein deacetylase|nr:hypothetical protein [Lachnospiraceae bacterium]